MIFLTLGSQKFQFNRILEAIDRLILEKKIKDKIFAQIGYSDYQPKNFEFKRFLDHDEFIKIIGVSDIVITHGGSGAIIGAIKSGKKVIAVPRLKKYGEHVDDHQLQIIRQFANLNLICECIDCDKLDEALDITKKSNYKSYKSNTDAIIKSISEFIGE